ncbi:HTH-type transcriptional regulator GltR [Bacillus subtilis]|uniref:LysR family transcriptional regulator n=1 Tax=Bacillus subtilis TaxID=1423 RepID=UPI000956B2AF|nr:LysR family transcriptional regulator [Bacillus subtilis]MCM3188769.1 LysR family transcriptional regulator [Bacillus subtilis]CAF1776645.1 HTH-type transcriptional regulator GltR [Bacillus subtilis]CAF1841445.1 HTH-type transcriptional regulator GltR [Bacillus subtilis]SIQ95664.1 DNA-binding transcriptional regulator, LysR family [Bacillus subtilis]
MEIRHLKTFITIVEKGGFTKAAEYLGYAQSTITSHIKDIEQEIGKPLFNRFGKKMLLTEVGERLFPYANEMIKISEKVKQIQLSDEPMGNLVIGAPESLTVYRLPQIIHEFKKLFPKVKVTLKSSTCWELKDDLRNGKVDLAFLLEYEQEESDLYIEKLITEPMILIFPEQHQLKNISFDDFYFSSDEVILYTEHGCSYRTYFEEYMKHQGLVSENTFEFWSVEAIKQCVLCGLGISLLPLITVQKELQENKLSGLIMDETRIITQMAYHKKRWLSTAMVEFMNIVKKHAELWGKTRLYSQ